MFHSVPDVARQLSCGQTTIWALLRDRKLPCVRIGRRTLISDQALNEFAQSLTSAKR